MVLGSKEFTERKRLTGAPAMTNTASRAGRASGPAFYSSLTSHLIKLAEWLIPNKANEGSSTWKKLEKRQKIWALVLTLSHFGTTDKPQVDWKTFVSDLKTNRYFRYTTVGSLPSRASNCIMNSPDPNTE